MASFVDMEISNDEYRDLIRWLNRREFLNFQLLGDEDDEHETCFFEASFNIDKIKIGDVLVGMELTMQTNKPFGYGQEQRVTWTVSDTTKTYLLSDISDEIGYIYPDITITINANGNLIGLDRNGRVCFTWQPHGSQFTIHTEVPESAIKFQIKQPPTISKADVLKVVEFDESWVQIIK